MPTLHLRGNSFYLTFLDKEAGPFATLEEARAFADLIENTTGNRSAMEFIATIGQWVLMIATLLLLVTAPFWFGRK